MRLRSGPVTILAAGVVAAAGHELGRANRERAGRRYGG